MVVFVIPTHSYKSLRKSLILPWSQDKKTQQKAKFKAVFIRIFMKLICGGKLIKHLFTGKESEYVAEA